jgi:hypothetical protein
MLALADSPPTSAKQLLTLVQHYVATLNAAVQHLPYAPRWSVSAAVRRSAKQLVQLLRDATASGYQDSPSSSCQPTSQQPGSEAGGLTDASGPAGLSSAAAGQVNGQAGHAGAAAGSGHQPAAAAAAAVGPSVMVGGRLVTAGVLQQGGVNGAGQLMGPGQMPRRRRRHDGEHRAKLIKKFSAKTQVRVCRHCSACQHL